MILVSALSLCNYDLSLSNIYDIYVYIGSIIICVMFAENDYG